MSQANKGKCLCNIVRRYVFELSFDILSVYTDLYI